ncbi:hypothetical protein KY289_017985 [Solanum tuberosum]|nr:hypothetical protein KY289_017985 [Solanum tuberosum]
MVYARSRSAKRMYLWDKLRTLSHMIHGPWIIGGDFNSIMDAEEKRGCQADQILHTHMLSIDS